MFQPTISLRFTAAFYCHLSIIQPWSWNSTFCLFVFFPCLFFSTVFPKEIPEIQFTTLPKVSNGQFFPIGPPWIHLLTRKNTTFEVDELKICVHNKAFLRKNIHGENEQKSNFKHNIKLHGDFSSTFMGFLRQNCGWRSAIKVSFLTAQFLTIWRRWEVSKVQGRNSPQNPRFRGRNLKQKVGECFWVIFWRPFPPKRSPGKWWWKVRESFPKWP